MALTTVEYFNSLPLGLRDRQRPAAEVVAVLLETASTQVEDFCDRKFAVQQHSEKFRGNDGKAHTVRQWPLVSVDVLAWRDSAGNVGTIDPAVLDFDPETGEVWFNAPYRGTTVFADAFYRGVTYTLTYTAGYDPIPGPVQHATALQVTELLAPNFGGPQEVAVEVVPLSSQLIVDLLDPKYKRHSIG